MVTVYSKDDCKQCELTQDVMGNKGIEFEVKPLEDPQNLAAVKAMGYMSAPVVVATADNHWAGFRPDLIGSLVS